MNLWNARWSSMGRIFTSGVMRRKLMKLRITGNSISVKLKSSMYPPALARARYGKYGSAQVRKTKHRLIGSLVLKKAGVTVLNEEPNENNAIEIQCPVCDLHNATILSLALAIHQETPLEQRTRRVCLLNSQVDIESS